MLIGTTDGCYDSWETHPERQDNTKQGLLTVLKDPHRMGQQLLRQDLVWAAFRVSFLKASKNCAVSILDTTLSQWDVVVIAPGAASREFGVSMSLHDMNVLLVIML